MTTDLRHGAVPFDLFASGVIANPYPWYRMLRDRSPIHYVPDRDSWVLSRFADVRAALLDQMELLARDRSLINSAVEETLRHDAPIQGLFRTSFADVILPSGELSTGARCCCCMARRTATAALSKKATRSGSPAIRPVISRSEPVSMPVSARPSHGWNCESWRPRSTSAGYGYCPRARTGAATTPPPP